MRTVGAQIKNTSTDDLSERIKIVYHEVTRNERGGIVKGEEKLRAECWAKVLPLIGRIDDETPERVNTVTYRITVRFRADIKPDDEILWRGQRFRLQTPPIDIESRRMWTMFDVREAVADGKAQKKV